MKRTPLGRSVPLERCSPLARSAALTRTSIERKRARASRPDQAAVRAEIAKVRAGEQTVAVAARAAECDPTYLAERIWREVKRDVIARDGWCVRCGVTDRLLDVHHRRSRKAGGTSDPLTAYGMANLVSLCRQHHSLITDRPGEGRATGLVLLAREDPAMTPVFVAGVGRVLLLNAGGYQRLEPG